MGPYLGSLPITPTGSLGRITVNPPQGSHIIILRFEDTLVRQLGTVLTLASLGLLLIGLSLRALSLRRAA
jgi:hypothetical protein